MGTGVRCPRGLFTFLLFLLLLLVFVGKLSGKQQNSDDNDLPIYDIALDHNDTHHLYWRVNYLEKQIQFEIHTRAKVKSPWLAIGFSDRGDWAGSDMCVFWTDWKKRIHFENALVDENNRMVVVDDNHCQQFRFKLLKNVIKFTYTRKFTICSPRHYTITRGTTHIKWSHGDGPLFRLGGLLAPGQEEGMVRAELLKPKLPRNEKEVNPITYKILVNNVHVPDVETTYWCSVQKLPEFFLEKHHIVEYGPSITPGNEDLVHHMELFHCEFPPNIEVPKYQGPCRSKDRATEIDRCKRVLAAWAMGASAFTYPSEAGLSIGGPTFGQYIMLEIHYNNPNTYSGRIDSSGIELHYTKSLRKHDVGIMELGLEYTDKMAIPPQLSDFTLSGHCIPECTALGLPQGGIFIFGSQLHTHGTGVKAWTTHIRGGEELPELNRDIHYSTHFQEIRRLPHVINVLPGDALIMTCEYSTLDRENVTVGGFAISDEMCVNYIHYYPKVDLEVCKSSIDTGALKQYFQFMNKWEYQNTTSPNNWRGNYHSIQWTPLRASMLSRWYADSPISMQCNRSSGDKFPGYWESMPTAPILHPLPEGPTECDRTQSNSPPDLDRSHLPIVHDIF